jgi:hypothetical protein
MPENVSTDLPDENFLAIVLGSQGRLGHLRSSSKLCCSFSHLELVFLDFHLCSSNSILGAYFGVFAKHTSGASLGHLRLKGPIIVVKGGAIGSDGDCEVNPPSLEKACLSNFSKVFNLTRSAVLSHHLIVASYHITPVYSTGCHHLSVAS